MQPITYDAVCYRIAGQPVYLNSGEMHYFRVPRADWRRRMDLFREAGGNCLATYVPWVLHEPEEGRFDFGSEACTDLEGFLETARDAGLYVIARPGPYQYSEMLYAGLPPWLCDNYPDLLARDMNGKPLRFYSVSYLHPLFLEKAHRWFRRVCPIIARHTVSRGGPVAFTQFDNEMSGIHVWYGSMDYNAETMGFGRPDGRWPRFLAERYGDVKTMNRLCGTAVRHFEDVRPERLGGADPFSLRRRKDYFDFYYAMIAEYAAVLAGWMRECGIDTPLVHNSANGHMNALFKPVVDALGEGFILGSDHYYTLGQDWCQNNPTPQYARDALCSLEMLRLTGVPPTVYELPGGSLSDWPPITPSDARTCYLANVAFGMKGHNYYIYTGGPNPRGIGNTTDVYDYGAAVGPDGSIRPLYEAQKEFGLAMSARPWLAESQRETDCRFALDWDMARSSNYWTDKGSYDLAGSEAWSFLQRGPLTTALCAGLSPAFCDLDRDDWVSHRDTPLVVAMCSVMGRARQERLVRFLESGGKALLAPVLPTHDERWEPCTVLRDFLGAGAVHPAGFTPTRLTIGGVVNIYNNGEACFPEILPPGAETVGIDERSGRAVAWARPTGRGGEALFLGFRWAHAMREHERMLFSLLERLGLRPKVRCSNPNVWVSLRTAGRRSMLFLLNLLTAPMTASVACRPSWSGEEVETGVHTLAPMSVKCVELPEASA